MRLSIIIPVYNEEKTLAEILRRVKAVKLNAITKEIIAVDDASKDKSLSILKRTSGVKIIRHKVNRGKGAAIRSGMACATGDIVIIQDADLEYNPQDFSKLIVPIIQGYAKVVYGTRLKTLPFQVAGKHPTPLPFHYLGNKLLTFITNLLFGSSLTDMETCYKVFDGKVARSLTLESDRFEIEPEITAKILKKGYTIYEVPIKVEPRGYAEGKKITWRDGFAAIWTLIKYKFT